MSETPELSIVIPLYNEVESLPHLKQALDEVLAEQQYETEILFVNDGSRDGSDRLLEEFAREDPRVRLLGFRRNRGKSAALDLAFHQARGKYVVTMDADLQDDPREIPRLIEQLEKGYDLVSGWKKKRHDPLSKTIPSRFFNWTARLISGIPLHDFNCGLKIYRREVLETIYVYGELHRFLPMLAASQGWRVGELTVQHHPRRWGVTKFGMARFLNGFLDMLSVTFITRYMSSPMHLFGTFGLLFSLGGIGILLYLSILWFMGVYIGNRPLFFLGILMMIVGVQFFSLGLIGELITHQMAKKRSQSDYLEHPPHTDDDRRQAS